MFDVFGEFDSAEEINKVAAAQLAEGDKEAIRKIAKENGIDTEDAEDYISGAVQEFVTPLLAAMGKLEIEAQDLDLKGIIEDWKETVMEICKEDNEICVAVRKKGKYLRDCMASLIKYSFEHKEQVSEKIVQVTKVNHNGKLEKMRSPLYLGVPNRFQVKKLIKEYYLS